MFIYYSKYSIVVILSIFLLCEKNGNDNPFTNSETEFLFINTDGWTVFYPSRDSRVLFISADGDDATGKVYTYENSVDPRTLSDSVYAFSSYSAAFANTREGYPDWILFRRGDTFYDAPGSS